MPDTDVSTRSFLLTITSDMLPGGTRTMESDVARVRHAIGRILAVDVGKRCYAVTSPSGYRFVQVESTEQRDERLAAGGGDRQYDICPDTDDGRHIPVAGFDEHQGEDFLTVACSQCGLTTGVPVPPLSDITWS